MFKEFHKALAADSQSSSAPETPTSTRNNSGGRKTRNSNGSRGIMSQPRLRSGKNYIKSDTDDEEGGPKSQSRVAEFSGASLGQRNVTSVHADNGVLTVEVSLRKRVSLLFE